MVSIWLVYPFTKPSAGKSILCSHMKDTISAEGISCENSRFTHSPLGWGVRTSWHRMYPRDGTNEEGWPQFHLSWLVCGDAVAGFQLYFVSAESRESAQTKGFLWSAIGGTVWHFIVGSKLKKVPQPRVVCEEADTLK